MKHINCEVDHKREASITVAEIIHIGETHRELFEQLIKQKLYPFLLGDGVLCYMVDKDGRYVGTAYINEEKKKTIKRILNIEV